MKLFFCLTWLALLGALSSAAGAAYPEKPIRVVVVYPPGGGIDILVRALGQKLTEAWGPPVIVDNRAGAGTTIATGIVAKSQPDGYTFLAADIAYAIAPSLYARSLAYDPLKELTPVTLLNLVADGLVVHPSLPVKSVKELIAYAKANPGKLLYPSAGNGSPNHLATEMFRMMAGIDLVHVPYKGAVAAVADLMTGREQIYIGALASLVAQIKAGRLRALAITGKQRSPALPDVPTVMESGLPNYDFSSWYGLLAPASTPAAIINKVYQQVKKTLAMSDIQERLAADGSVAVGSTPQEFGSFIAAEMKKWGKVVKAAGVKVD